MDHESKRKHKKRYAEKQVTLNWQVNPDMQETSYSPSLFVYLNGFDDSVLLGRGEFYLGHDWDSLLMGHKTYVPGFTHSLAEEISLAFSFPWFFWGAYVLSLLISLLISTSFASLLCCGYRHSEVCWSPRAWTLASICAQWTYSSMASSNFTPMPCTRVWSCLSLWCHNMVRLSGSQRRKTMKHVAFTWFQLSFTNLFWGNDRADSF